MRRLRHGLVIVGVFGALLLSTTTSVGAGPPPDVDWRVETGLEGYVDVLEIELRNDGGPCDDSGTTVTFLDDDDPIGQAPLSGANAGTVVVPDDLPTTFFAMDVTCTTTGGPVTAPVLNNDQDFDVPFVADYAGLDVTKAVEGDVPDGTEFTIEVDCTAFGDGGGQGEDPPDVGPYDLVYPADGGTDRVWFSFGHVCELTETDDGGATSTTITSEDCDDGPGDGPAEGNGAEQVAILGPVTCDATVTNVFATATTPPTTQATTTTAEPADVAPATAAQPTTASPTFTG